MWKYVDFGCFEMENCIQYRIRAELGDSPHMPCCQGFAQLEAPTAYLNSDFDAVSFMDPVTGTITRQNKASGESEQLVIIHTEDQEFAFGVISEPRGPTAAGIPGLKYAYFSFNIQPFDQKTFKWSVVVREDLQSGHVFDVHSYICVGTLENVRACLMTINLHLSNDL